MPGFRKVPFSATLLCCHGFASLVCSYFGAIWLLLKVINCHINFQCLPYMGREDNSSEGVGVCHVEKCSRVTASCIENGDKPGTRGFGAVFETLRALML